jgi:hypothetical protein
MYVILLNSFNLFMPQRDFYHQYLMAEIPCAMDNDFWTNSVRLLEEQKAS